MKRRLENDIFGRPPRVDGINSKKKGDNNERIVASLLSEWTGVKFTRVPRSGGLDWKNNDTVYGDVVSTDRDFNFPFSIETKAYKDINVGLNTLRKNSIVFKFWQQCVWDAEKSGKIPMLLIRKNGMPKKEYMLYVSFRFYTDLSANTRKSQMPKVVATGNVLVENITYSLVGFSSEEFFEKIKYKELINFVSL